MALITTHLVLNYYKNILEQNQPVPSQRALGASAKRSGAHPPDTSQARGPVRARAGAKRPAPGDPGVPAPGERPHRPMRKPLPIRAAHARSARTSPSASRPRGGSGAIRFANRDVGGQGPPINEVSSALSCSPAASTKEGHPQGALLRAGAPGQNRTGNPCFTKAVLYR